MCCAFVQMQLVNERVKKYIPAVTHCICAKLQHFQLLCRHTFNLQHITYILKSFGPSASPRAYAHNISPHIVHPSLTHCISAKVSSSGTCRHTYSMQLINYIFGKLWPFHLSVSICTLYTVSSHIVHPPLTHCISATVSPFCTL